MIQRLLIFWMILALWGFMYIGMAGAESICVKIPIATTDFPAYKQRYFDLTGEKVGGVVTNIEETHYLMCSSRLKQTVADQIVTEDSRIKIYDRGKRPADWVAKE